MAIKLQQSAKNWLKRKNSAVNNYEFDKQATTPSYNKQAESTEQLNMFTC